MSLVPCTTPDCKRPTSTYLCDTCTRDLQAWLDRIPELREELFTTMARLDNVRPTGQTGGSGGKADSLAPARFGAMDARFALAIWEGRDARDLAKEEHAGGYTDLLRKLIEHGERLIDIPDERFTHGTCGDETGDGICTATLTADPDAVWANCESCGTAHNLPERRKQLTEVAFGIDPLPPREAREWLKDKAGISIKGKDFENWVSLGHLRYVLDRVTTDAKPRRVYFPGDVFRVHDAMTTRRRLAV